jgi:hypothetical protein
MSEIENRKAGRVLATATVAAVVGLAAGAGAMLWLRGGMPVPTRNYIRQY